jgi:L-methionine (R)-S-oxide reductase
MIDELRMSSQLQELVKTFGGVAGSVHVVRGDELVMVAALNLPEPVRRATAAIPRGKGMAGLAWERDEPVQTCNLKADTTGDVRPGARAVDAKGAIALPVHGADNRVTAVVGIAFDDEREFSESEVGRLMDAAAAVLSDGNERGSVNRMREKAVEWLMSRQHETGPWTQRLWVGGEMPSVSITALAVNGLREAGADALRAAVERAATWLADQQQDNGAFGDGPDGRYFREYSTGLTAWALAAVDPDRYGPAVARAVDYLRNNQRVNGLYLGGIGYGMVIVLPTPTDPNGEYVRQFAAMSPTSLAADGMSRAGVGPADPFWSRVIEYVRSCQNDHDINTRPEIIEYLAENGYCLSGDGGMVPTMENFRRPDEELADLPGKPLQPIIPQGISTYQGIRIYLRAGVSPGSPEITRALDWVRHHYTVTEHVGFSDVVNAGQRRTWGNEHTGLVDVVGTGEQPSTRLAAEPRADELGLTGLYLYLWSMAQVMRELGVTTFRTADGGEHDWAAEIAAQLGDRQRPDGSWANENPRWLEFDSSLCTAFALNTLNLLG